MRRLLTLLGAAGALACGDGGAPNGGVAFEFTDPVNDTLPAGTTTALLRALDAEKVSGYVTDDSLIFTVQFTRSVAATNSGEPNAVFGLIEIDADASRNTGYVGFLEQLGANATLGVEHVVLFMDDTASSALFLDIAAEQVHPVTMQVSGSKATLRIPRSIVTGGAGTVRIAGLVGNEDRPTDLVPNGNYYAVADTEAGVDARTDALDAGAPAGVLREVALPLWLPRQWLGR